MSNQELIGRIVLILGLLCLMGAGAIGLTISTASSKEKTLKRVSRFRRLILIAFIAIISGVAIATNGFTNPVSWFGE